MSANFAEQPKLPPVTIRNYASLFKRLVGLGMGALLIVNVLDLLLPLVVRRFVDLLSQSNTETAILYCALTYLGIAAVQAVSRFTWRLSLARAGVGAAADVRARIGASAIFTSPTPEVGKIVSLVQSDAESFGRAFDIGIVILVDSCLNVILVPIIMLSLDPRLALATLMPMPFISVVLFLCNKKIRNGFTENQNALSVLSGTAESAISRVRAIKVNTAEQTFLHRFGVESLAYLNAGRRLTAVESVLGPSLEFLISVSMVSLMVVGGGDVTANAVTLGTFLAFQK